MYEILIRFDADDKFQGGQSIDKFGDPARAIAAQDWPAICGAIDAASLARCDQLRAELAALKTSTDAFRAHATQSTHAARDAIANTTLDDAATVAAIAQIVESVLTPERDRKLAAALDSRAKLDAEIAALGG